LLRSDEPPFAPRSHWFTIVARATGSLEVAIASNNEDDGGDGGEGEDSDYNVEMMVRLW
jgi:hypothetical protein